MVPIQDMSTGQKLAVVLAVLIEMHLSLKSVPHFLLIDEPVANVDDLNILSMLDLFRELVVTQDCQLFVTTANQNVARLFRRKFSFLGKGYAEFAFSRAEDMMVSITRKTYDQDHMVDCTVL